MLNNVAYQNKSYFENVILKYPNLASIVFNQNYLVWNNIKVNLNDFSLQTLKPEVFTWKPEDFLKIVHLHSEAQAEINRLTEPGYYANAPYLKVMAILVKNKLNNSEKQILKLFASSYQQLHQFQDYLVSPASNKLNKMQKIINSSLNPEQLTYDLTEGRIYFKNLLDCQTNLDLIGPVRCLRNPDFPTTLTAESDSFIPRAGFITIILLIYISLNLIFILVISLLTK